MAVTRNPPPAHVQSKKHHGNKRCRQSPCVRIQHTRGHQERVFHFVTSLQTSWAAVQGLVLSGLLSCLLAPEDCWSSLFTPTETDTMAEAAKESGSSEFCPVESGIGEGMLKWSLLVNNKQPAITEQLSKVRPC